MRCSAHPAACGACQALAAERAGQLWCSSPDCHPCACREAGHLCALSAADCLPRPAHARMFELSPQAVKGNCWSSAVQQSALWIHHRRGDATLASLYKSSPFILQFRMLQPLGAGHAWQANCASHTRKVAGQFSPHCMSQAIPASRLKVHLRVVVQGGVLQGAGSADKVHVSEIL